MSIVNNQRGVAIMEFAILLPLLAMISIASLELVRTSGALKVAVQMSREAANIAFRDCIGVGEPTNAEDRQLLLTCLNERRAVTNTFNQSWGRPGIEVLLSYYEVVEKNGVPVVEYWGTSSSGVYPTKFDASKLLTEITKLPGERIVVAEVYVPHRAIVPGIAGLFHYDPDFLYDLTVL